jgi:hypothetical protein
MCKTEESPLPAIPIQDWLQESECPGAMLSLESYINLTTSGVRITGSVSIGTGFDCGQYGSKLDQQLDRGDPGSYPNAYSRNPTLWNIVLLLLICSSPLDRPCQRVVGHWSQIVSEVV